jgi:hypothetical protein
MPKVYTGWTNGEGISDKDENGFDVTQNLDTTSNLGTVQAQYALKLDNSTVNEPCYMAQDTDGNRYYFSATSGQIWKYTASTMTTALVRTNGSGEHYGAKFFNGDIYYFNRNLVGQYDIATNTWTDSFGTFANGARYHPSEIVNNILHIGDGKDVVSIQIGGNFNESALDVETDHTLSALINDNSYLLTGTTVSNNISTAKAYYWDTYSSSWTIEDDVVTICFYFRCDNDLFALGKTASGTTTILFWNGNKLEKYRPVRNASGDISVQATAQLEDKTLFAIGSHVYTLYKPFGGSYGLIREYTADSTIQSIMVSSDTIFVSTQTGIYTKDTNNRATAVITMPFHQEMFKQIEALYQNTNGCTIGLETNINDAGWVTESNFLNDSTNNKYLLVNGVSYAGKVNYGRVRITLNPVSDLSPVLNAVVVK